VLLISRSYKSHVIIINRVINSGQVVDLRHLENSFVKGNDLRHKSLSSI